MRLRGSLIVMALVALSAVAPAAAQIRGIPPSVTSLGGSHSPGIPASVTSINNRPIGCCVSTAFPNTVFRLGTNFGHRTRFRIDARFGRPSFQPLFIEVPVAVPVEVPVVVVPTADPNAQVVEEDAPRRVVRRRVGEEEDPPAAAAQPAVQQPAPEAKPLPATVLVFRDGRRAEVHDYAISGDTFYDLSNGLTRKIKLVDLDLDATVKINDERGVPFSVPVTSASSR